MKMNNTLIGLKRKIAIALTAGVLMIPSFGFAAETSNQQDIDSVIRQQQQLLQVLNEKKAQAQSDIVIARIDSLEKQIRDFKADNNFDAKAAFSSLADQVNSLREQVQADQQFRDQIMTKLKEIENKQTAAITPVPPGSVYENENMPGLGSTSRFLVNPAPSAEVSYTQDALNAQGNSTMIFRYSPNQLYKIYCRTGFLTDMAFAKGEKITFAGGGDTSGWSVSTTDVDGTPHLYIKPVVESSSTNLIVTTTHHSYQIILNTSDWYNPMVRWTYDAEEQNANLIQQQKDEKLVTGRMNVSSPDSLNFEYEISGSNDADFKPTMVFDDGQQTFIKFKRLGQKTPVLFLRERGRKTLDLVNYRIKDNCFIVDKVFNEAQLRMSDKDIITIRRKS